LIIASNKNLHIVLLGCGFASKIHSRTIRSVDTGVDISFASRSEAKSKDYAKKYKGKNSYASYGAAIQDPEIDVVMINTPPASHFDLAKRALTQGKHVIVEKPPFKSSDDFDTLASIADSNKVQLMVAENYYYKPLRYKLVELLQSGVIGKPLFINISATKKQNNEDWRNDPFQSFYGALFEGGIHWINFINNLGYKIKKIGGIVPGDPLAMEKSIQVTAQTENGPVINISYSWEVDTLLKGVFRKSRIYGTEGSISFETNGIYIFVRGKKIRLYFPKILDIAGYKAMFKDFIKAIRTETPPSFTWQMAKQDLVFIENIYKTK
jgi:predicted dehydrogenase